MSYNPNNPNGQATAANSAPVVLDTTDSGYLATIAANSSNQGSVTPVYEDFSSASASGISSSLLTLLQTGTGMTVSQSSGNLVITTGTTANSETIIRSNSSFTGSLLLKESTVLSQRIANNNFYIELVDVIQNAASYTINSATSVTVTYTTNPFTSANVGQFMYLGAITGAAGIPGRYAIASVSGSTVNYTVAGWPASGSGTLDVFGWNYYHLYYTSTTATNVNFDTQRNGWANGDTTATINTTTSPGHMALVSSEDNSVAFFDQLIASFTTNPTTLRSSKVTNVPSSTTPLYLQIRALNGTTAPASTTTWTIDSVSIESINSNPVTIGNVKTQSVENQLPVTIAGGTLPTVTTVSTVSSATVAAVNSVATTNGLTLGTQVSPTTPAALSIKASAGRLHFLQVGNPNTQVVYVKLFNATSVTLGTTSANMNFLIPASSSISVQISDVGLYFSTGIQLAVTGGESLTDNTAITTGCAVNYSYI